MSSDQTPNPSARVTPPPSQQPQPITNSPRQTLSDRRRSPPPSAIQPLTKHRRLPKPSSLDNHSDYTNRSASPDPHDVSRPKKSKPRGDVRRVWNRRALESSGISDTLLHALDDFTSSVPPIPTTIDLSRKIPIRNMRKWIGDLENPAHNTTWTKLVDALRTDNSAQRAWASDWDHDICRFILGVLVSEDQTKNRTDKRQSRQAVNNAIKRELTCPTESRTSSRSKTFRDLFREKCTAAGVPVPQLSETHPKPTRPPTAPRVIRPEISPHAATPEINVEWDHTTLADLSVTTPPLRTFLPLHPRGSGSIQLESYRERCNPLDEWGRTAWWRLSSEQAVRRVPKLLAEHSAWELRSMLLDFRWIMRTFRYVDFSKGMRQVPTMGYDELLRVMRQDKLRRYRPVEVEGIRLIRNALMLIMPILARDEIRDPTEKGFLSHLATQLVGRLLNLKRRFPVIAELIQSIQLYAPRPWLRPLTPCFQEPSTDIKIAVPSNGTFTPHLIDLSQDGKLLAISGTERERKFATPTTVKTEENVDTNPTLAATGIAKKYNSIRVWDVESGKLAWVVDGISSFVRCLALAWDCSCVVGETVDGLFFWPLEKGVYDVTRKKIDATPRPKSVTSITPTVEERLVLTTSRSNDEPAISLWDTKTGRLLKVFAAVQSRATCVDVSLDKEYFASGHKNGFIHLWHLWSKGDGDYEPVLSFKNEGKVPENGQQHVDLSKTNSTADNLKTETVSISFLDTSGDSSWLAAAAADEVIRVWLLPPRSITRKSKTFVSSLRRAVIQCPRVREVQWSLRGGFFSSGDDGIVRLWRKRKSGMWEPHAIGRDKKEHPSTLSTVFVSSGKQSELVATYVTKSPYVTVWDTCAFKGEDDCEIRKRTKLYRPYFCVVKDSVDSTDIAHLTTLKRVGRTDGMTTSTNGSTGHEAHNRGMSDYALGDSARMIRKELEWFFSTLDLKYATQVSGEMNPRLRTVATGRGGVPLEICFEQPVIHGVSGTFKTATMVWAKVNSKVAQKFTSAFMLMSQGTGEIGLEEEEEETHGTVVALLNGEIGIFELHDEEGHDGAMSPSTSMTGQGNGVRPPRDDSVSGVSGGGHESGKERGRHGGGDGATTHSAGSGQPDDEAGRGHVGGSAMKVLCPVPRTVVAAVSGGEGVVEMASQLP